MFDSRMFKSKEENTLWGCFGISVALFIGTVLSTVVNGWALMTLWGWFIVPVFELPSLTIVKAIGVAMVISFLTKHHNLSEQKKGSTSEMISFLIGSSFVLPAITVLIGFIVHLFM